MVLRHWNKLLNTDCVVVRLGGHHIYPIFKNASSSLLDNSDGYYVNDQISDCRNVMIFLRDPEKRFVSGLNEYCRQNGLDINETWKRVNAGELVDRHFAPQMIWLMHLYRYYKGDVSVKPFSEIKAYCRVHMNSAKHKEYVDPVKDFIDMDRQLMKYTNRTVGLKKLVEEYKNVLS